jgi:CRISPR/Cas system endoribonuclease Cas6 (RAMP superfamily)
MQLGGITGRMVYLGDNLATFLPLLRYCEKTHLGKQTTFGLGHIRVETPV